MTAVDSAWISPGDASGSDPSTTALPRPTRERWQPLRLGLVDLFHYDDEQFWFHDGRLLLRGNNGTGKSKVLALTLPFLLDGSILARRVEPDADPKKRMEWNLLLGGAHPSTERTGYSWVEFGRVDAEGREHFLTLGIGLKAASGRGIVKTWYFTSTRRIGDLRLLDDHRTVLSQERLRDALAEGGSGDPADLPSGQLHPTQEAYRRAVDEAMFRLGEDRYAALVDLLIQLRQPQLSKKPDEKALSAALTEALAPLDQAVVADVAESFRSLEEERDGIADAKDTLTAAEAFLRHYRVYAKVAARRHTTAVRLANSAFEHAGRDLREAEEQLVDVTARVARLREQQSDAEIRQSDLQGQEQGLRESPEMRDAGRLQDAASAANDMESRAEQAGAASVQAGARAQRETEAEAEAVLRREAATAEAQARRTSAARLAGQAGLASVHESIALDEVAARRAVDRREQQLHHVEGLLATSTAAQARLAQRRNALDEAEAEQTHRGEVVQEAHMAVGVAVTAYRDRVREHARGLSEIVLVTGADELAGQAEDWARSLAGESPPRVEVEAAATAARNRIGTERAEADHAGARVAGELAAARSEIATLEAGRDPEPPSAPGRDRDARQSGRSRPGAPLWRLTDFAVGVADHDRAGLEAALQSAGLLDAWVFPDGTVTTQGDVVLGPHGPQASPALADLLVAAVEPADDGLTDVTTGVLSRIGLGEDAGAALWVDPQGSWGAGPARGAWSKARAEYVGAGARAAHRRAVLASLLARADDLEGELAALRERVAAAGLASDRVHDELAGYPTSLERELAAAHERVAAAQREHDLAQVKSTDVRRDVQQAADEAEAAEAEVAEQAEQLSVGSTSDEITAARAALVGYDRELVEVRAAERRVSEAVSAAAEAAERLAEASVILERSESEWRDRRGQARSLRAKYDALQATVGASVAELQERLTEIATQLEQVGRELKVVARQQLGAAAERGSLEEKVRDLGLRRTERADEREVTIGAVRAFATTGLLRVALADLVTPDPESIEEWHVTAALALSRQAEQQLVEVDESEESWARSQQRVSSAATELAAQMSRHGHTSFIEQHGNVLVARVRYRNDEVDIDRLAERLAADVDERERLLSAREREILENHLVNEVAGHLHELLGTAEGQIDRMNRELAERKTSTGMQLRVRWRDRPDGPAGLAAARDLLVRSDATWTAEDRTAIGDFLQAQIAEARETDPTGGWQEHLEHALDYRQWHTFAVERWQNGQWRSASGPASGGEKVLAVSVPLFAAASAHYNSAGPYAPRLIMLDEAFAGVDDDSRAKSLGLLATFDLDVVMTSEREWGCYPQVPGLSIAQLSRVEGVDAVGVTRWRWDGRRRQRVADADAADRAGGEAPSQADDAALFG